MNGRFGGASSSRPHWVLVFLAVPLWSLVATRGALGHDPAPPPHGPVLFTDGLGHNHLFAHSFNNGDGTTTHDHRAFAAWHNRTYDQTAPFGHGFIEEDRFQPRYSFTPPGGAGNSGTALNAAQQGIMNAAFDAWEAAAHAAGPALPGRRTGIDFDNNNTTFEFRVLMIDNLVECRGALGEWATLPAELLADSNRDTTGDGVGDCPVAIGAAYTTLPAGLYLLFDDDTNWANLALGGGVAPAAGQTDFATIALHEAGHVVGLLHTPGDPAGHIMRASIVNEATGGNFNRTIEGDSAAGAAELYTVTRGIRSDHPNIPTGKYEKLPGNDPVYVTQFGEITLTSVTHDQFRRIRTGSSGADVIHSFDSRLSGIALTPLGPMPFEMFGPVEVILYGMAGHETGIFDTEMLSMDMTGLMHVPGYPEPISIALRESPTLASLGRTEIQAVTDGVGNYAIDSFFDVFTELSVAGLTPGFVPAVNGPTTAVLVPEPSALAMLLVAGLVGLAGARRRHTQSAV
jgi:hypothetical protein